MIDPLPRPPGSGDCLKKNLAVLSRFYPDLAGTLDGNEPGGAYHVEPSASGAPTLRVNGVYAHSRRDPAREASRAAGALLADRGGAFFILGFGLGYSAEAAAVLNPNAIPVIVERSPELFRLALQSREQKIFLGGKAIVLTGGSGIGGVLEMLRRSGVKTGKAVLKNKIICEASEEDKAFYDEIEKRILLWASKDDINRATLRRFGRRWTANLGANLTAVRDVPGISALQGILRGIPVFLAAAGPTLNAAKEHLDAIQERCVTVVTDTALRFFNGGCDFVVSVDPQFLNARHLYHAPRGVPCLLAESAVYPAIMRLFSRRLLCQSLFPLGRYVEDRCDPKSALGAGGSVATSAWDFARYLGPGEIWISGLDLGFPCLQTHFKGALFEELAHSASNRFAPAETTSFNALHDARPFFVPSAGGGRVLSDRRLSLYAAWFENAFAAASIPSYAILANGAGGTAINGLCPRPMEELLALPKRRDEINAILESAFAGIARRAEEEREKRSADYDNAVGGLKNGLREIIDLADAGLAVLGANSQNHPNRPDRKREKERDLLERLDHINKKIQNSAVKDSAGFLFPSPEELEGRLTKNAPLERHFEFQELFYRSLTEAVSFTLEKLTR
ncbi:MAG: DUF115 domain-containing protein [Treponema sp.]|jgi:hypothetical protein|nr:DUF115 domain-containing protein [Treponema sp.]